MTIPTTIEQLEVDIQSNATPAVSGIDSLSASLTKLKNATKGGTGLTRVANQTRNLNSALQGVDSSATNKIDKLVSSLEKLKGLGQLKISTSIASQLGNIGTVASSLERVDFRGLEKLGTALAPLNSMGKATGLSSTVNALKKLPEIADTLNGMDWVSFTSQMQQLSTSLTPLANQLNTVSAAYTRLPANIRKTVTATSQITQENDKATSSYANLYAKAMMAVNAMKTGVHAIASWITQANQYIEDVNLFTASMGEYAGEAQKYAEQVGEILGIDPGEFMRNQGTFNTIISGFGVASDKAYLMSKNLTQLGYDISSFFNISVEDAMQKVQSGIAGELEPLRRLGYDLSVARLQEEALALGIQKKVSAMTQAEKSQLRYYAIMTQVTTAHGDMARTLSAPANQLRILQAQVTQCARALGNIFIPVLNAVLPYAIALAKVIRMLANALASLFGFKLPEVDYFGISAGASAVGDLADNAGDASSNLGKAGKAAKKLKNALLGIDELNVLNPEDNSSSGSGSGSGGGGGIGNIDLPTYDFLKDAISSKVDEIVQMIKDAMWEITAVISTFLLAIGTILVVTGANIPLGLGLMAIGAVGLAASIIENWDVMTERLAKVLTVVTSLLAGFLLAIGAFLVFSGANVPLGAGLMVAGAVALGTAVTINWKFLNGDVKNALSMIEAIVSGALLGIGALFAFTGVDVPLGIALMAAGAVGLAAAAALNWNSLSEPMKKVIATLESIVAGGLLAIGILVAVSGNLPIGIALIAAGAVALVSAVALNWNGLTGNVRSVITSIVTIVSGALLGIGAILAFTTVNVPLGVALIAAGAVGLATTAGLNWNGFAAKIKRVLKEIGIAVGAALIAVGAILAFTLVALPLGVALIAAGAASLAAGVALNWNGIVSKIKGVLTKIKSVAGSVGKLALGLILCLTGVGIPVGVALIKSGVSDFTTGHTVNWDTMVQKVKSGLGKISESFEGFKEDVGKKLNGTEKKISTWSGKSETYFSSGAAGVGIAGRKYGENFQNGVTEKFKDSDSWVKEKVTEPVRTAIAHSKPPKYSVELENNASNQWAKAKQWWADVSSKGLNVESSVKLVKSGWTTVKSWIGYIPTLSQGISLLKSGWTTVRNWIGYIPTLNQAIALIKSGWTTVKNWIGTIPTLSQGISLIKSGWTTVRNWIGNIPTLVQGIALGKSGWTTVKNWIGTIPVLMQGIGLIKSGWSTIANWIGNQVVNVGISLYKSGWSSIAGFVGTSVSVGISLFKDGWNNIKNFFGLSNGGIVGANGGVKMFASGGIITPNMWSAMPKYTGGTNRAHGSMFVAGESGAELVGHVNGNTEVLNRFQLASVMEASIVNGMSQFAMYWQAMSRDLVTCANGIINAVVVSTAGINDNLVLATAEGYDPTHTMAQTVYEDSQKAYDRSYSDDVWARNMRDFYREYVEPTLKDIASDAKRQADKKERTIVQVGNRTISDAVTTQKDANGYSFTE